MIIYGSKATEVATENIAEKCSNCGTQHSIQMSVFQKYVHIFWIPFFPIGKTGVTQCIHCKQVLEKSGFGSTLKEAYEAIKKTSKTPVWTFAGLIIIAGLAIWGAITDKQNDAENTQLILAPLKGDVYGIKMDYKRYTLYKVNNIVGDTVFLLLGQYEVNKLMGLIDLKKKGDEAYGEEVFPLVKTDLMNMLDKGEIIDIERK
jgi:hypothetical protein